MNVVVTGGAGFIGSHLVHQLVKQGMNVTVIDVQDCKVEDIRYFCDDILSMTNNQAKLAFKDADAVVHLAAEHDIDAANDEGFGFVYHNLMMDLLVANWHNLYCPNAKYIYASSVDIYYMDDESIKRSMVVYEDMDDLIVPNNPYARSKFIGEQIVNAKLTNYYNFRFSTIYGPNQDSHHVLSEIRRAIEDENTIFESRGPLTAQRDYLYVGELVDLLSLAIKKSDPLPGVFNACMSHTWEVRDFADVMCRITKSKLRIIEGETTRHNDKHHPKFGIRNAEQWFGWKPKIHIGDGIKEMF